MGVVWRAVERSLGRTVAIKVLPSAVAHDPARLARFEREARLLATLNHTNVATIYGVHDTGGVRFLAMEFVEGDDLAAVLARGRLSASDVIRLAGHAGLILGTAAYIAPEQARGQAVDKRADIWAFGAVLFEMASGHRPFGGATVTDVLDAVVHAEPDWRVLPYDTPQPLADLIRRCLVKDPRRRWRDLGDARLELEALGRGLDGTAGQASDSRRPATQLRPAAVTPTSEPSSNMRSAADSGTTSPPQHERRWVWPAAAALVALAALVGYVASGPRSGA